MNEDTQQFKELLRVAMNFESYAHRKAFDLIPEEIFDNIFDVNFNRDLTLAQQILTHDLDSIDRSDLDREIKNIKNYESSINLLSDFINNNKKVILVTDTDNDGSSAQALSHIFIEEYERQYSKKPNLDVLFAQFYTHNPDRGITVDVINDWVKRNNIDTSQEFLVVTADNGISSKKAQEAILDQYSNAQILITDHHIPNPNYAVYDSSRSLVFDPMINPRGYFQHKNISGAMVWGELLKGVIEQSQLDFSSKSLEDIDSISRYSNMLDYVTTDIRLKPLKEYEIGKYTRMGVLLNVNNSLSPILTGDITNDDVDQIKNIIGEDQAETIKDLFDKIRQQNVVAYKLLEINERAEERAQTPKVNFDNDYMVAMTTTGSVYDDFDFNHVSKLRPLLLRLSVDEDKSDYETRMQTKMMDVFHTLKNLEREVINIIRESDLVHNVHRDYADFMIPKNNQISTIFNRKMLNKAYNIANNGFVMFVSQNNSQVISGSFRSQYNISSILENKEVIENNLNINIEILGHEKAAGFYITPTQGTELSYNTIEKLSDTINQNIDSINKTRQLDNKQYIETDLETLALFNQINNLVRSNVGNVEAAPVLVKIKPSDYVTDKKTAETKNVNDVLKESNYGYFTVPLTFTKDAILIPNGVAKEAQKHNFSSYLYTNYIDSGTFMVSGVAHFINEKNIKQIKTGHHDRKVLHDFFRDYYLPYDDPRDPKNYSVSLTNEELKNIPYYKYNAYGNTDFRNVEAAIINTMENMNASVYSICDVEATGLGQSPKLINVGFLNLRIDPYSGFVVDQQNYDDCVLATQNNKRYYVNPHVKQQFNILTQDDFENLTVEQRKDVLFDQEGTMFYSEQVLDVQRIFNEKPINDYVLINRQLVGESIAILVNNHDTKVTPDLAKLTNIDNWMLNKLGIDSKTTDHILLEKFKNEKTIFETHNGINYDGNVVLSNLPQFARYYGNSLQIDSIIFSKNNQLAYDDVNVAKFNNIPELKNIFFYCDEYCDYSLKNFLSSNTDGLYPDYSDRYLLKTEGQQLYLIDKKIHETYQLSISKQELSNEVQFGVEFNKLSNFVYENMDAEIMHQQIKDNNEQFQDVQGLVDIKPIDQNYRKYSVVKLGEQQSVRNMLLDTLPEINYTQAPANFSHDASLLWDHYMAYYHFDRSPNENIKNFINALKSNSQEDELFVLYDYLEDFLEQTEQFLDDNIDIHQRFKESWVVKRILASYEPQRGEDLSADRIKLTSWQTAIPEDKIEKYAQLVLDFKEKYQIDDFYTEEKHNNIVHKIEGTPYENERDLGLGDVIQEAHVALNQLSNRMENNYDIAIPTTETILDDTLKESTTKMLKTLLKTVPANSYSRAQAESYRNTVYSDKIMANIYPDENKIKLRVLPANTGIFFNRDQGKATSENMQQLVEDIDFITKVSIIRNSGFQGDLDTELIENNYGINNPYYDQNTQTPLDVVVNANINEYLEKVDEVYKRNGDYYFSKADNERKKVFDELANLCIDPQSYEHGKLELNYIESKDNNDYYSYIESLADYMKNNLNKDDSEIDTFKSRAENFMSQVVGTGFSTATSVKQSLDYHSYKVLYVPVGKRNVSKFVNDECSHVYENLLDVSVQQSLQDKFTNELTNKKQQTHQNEVGNKQRKKCKM